MNYMKLIKLLYLMDREALIRWSRPVTGAKYYSMRLGPVLSEVRDLLTEPTMPGQEGYWAKHISPPSEYEVTLVQDARSLTNFPRLKKNPLTRSTETLVNILHSI